MGDTINRVLPRTRGPLENLMRTHLSKAEESVLDRYLARASREARDNDQDIVNLFMRGLHVTIAHLEAAKRIEAVE